jgi:hypothetical protein
MLAALSRLRYAAANIMTVEDPIECDLVGIGQTQVNDADTGGLGQSATGAGACNRVAAKPQERPYSAAGDRGRVRSVSSQSGVYRQMPGAD